MLSNDIRLRLSAQRALWGHIPVSLRAVSVAHEDDRIHVRSIFATVISDHDRELLSMAGTEIIADFAAPYTIEEEFLVVIPPQGMNHLEHIVYLRYEPEPYDYAE